MSIHTSKAYQEAILRNIHVRPTKRQCPYIHQEPIERRYHTSEPIMGQYNTYMSKAYQEAILKNNPGLPKGNPKYACLAHQGAMSTKYKKNKTLTMV